MDKVGIVILNYLNYQDTIDCIKSLEIDSYENKEIIIVDNDSNNDSYNILRKTYEKKDNIHIIKNNKNLGFAKGNNEGILYARKNLNCNHVLLLNSDTFIEDNYFITSFINSYKKGIGIIGCRIIKLDKGEQNPHGLEINREIIENTLYKHKNNKYTIKEKFFYTKTYNILKRTLFRKVRMNKNKEKVKQNICSLDLVLHGACFLLTKDYFEYYPYLYPETFLYCEEYILTLLTKKVGLKKLFINNTFINHKEGQSSKITFKSNKQIKRNYCIESYSKCYKLFDINYEEIYNKYFVK